MGTNLPGLISNGFSKLILQTNPNDSDGPQLAQVDTTRSGKSKDTFMMADPRTLLDKETSAKLEERYKELDSNYGKLTKGEEKLDNSFELAVTSHILGKNNSYYKWKKEALENAASLPSSELFALPVTKAEFDSVEGNFKEAIEGYDKSLTVLKDMQKAGFNTEKEIKDINSRLVPVLLSHGMSLISQHKDDGLIKHYPVFNIEVENKRLDEAIQVFQRIYEIDPSERSLGALLGAFEQSAWDLAKTREKIDDIRITLEEYAKHIDPVETLLGERSDIILDNGLRVSKKFLSKDPHIMFDAIMERMRKDWDKQQMVALQNSYEFLKTHQAKFEKAIVKMIGKADITRQQKELQLANLYGYLGDQQKVELHFWQAHSAYVDDAKENGDTAKGLAADITVLHRLVTMRDKDYKTAEEYLKVAKEQIGKLFHKDRTQAELLKAEHLYLKAGVKDYKATLELRREEIEEGDFYERATSGYQDAIDYAAARIRNSKDADVQAKFAKLLVEARVDLYSKGMSRALMKRNDPDAEEGEALLIRDTAQCQLDSDMKFYKTFLKSPDYKEAMARAEYSLAYYQFRAGEIESSIANLKSISKEYPESTSAKIMFASGSWPRERGITVKDNKFSPDIGKPSFSAGLKQFASKLDDQQGRALVACGVGAVVAAGTDIVAGTKVGGATVIGGCIAGSLIDRAFVVGESWNEIQSAYSAGISNVDGKEAAMSTAFFFIDLLSMFVAGGAAYAARRAAGGTLLFMKSGMRSFLVWRGAVKGSIWKRPVAGLFIREASYIPAVTVFNSVFTEMSGPMKESVAGHSPVKKANGKDGDSGPGFFETYLFLRLLPVFYTSLSAGRKFIPGPGKANAAARFGVDTSLASTAITGLTSIFSEKQDFTADNVAKTTVNLAVLGGAMKGIEALMSAKRMGRVGEWLDEMNYKEKIKEPRAKRGVDETYNIGEGQVWVLRRGTEEAVHLYDFAKVTIETPIRGLIIKPTRWAWGKIMNSSNGNGVKNGAKAESKAPERTEPTQRRVNYDSLGWFGRRTQVVKDTVHRLRTENWSKYRERPDAEVMPGESSYNVEAYRRAVKDNTAPWKKRERKWDPTPEEAQKIAEGKAVEVRKWDKFSEKNVDAAVNRFTNPAEGAKAPDTTVFKTKPEADTSPSAKPLKFAKFFYGLNDFLTWPLRALGRYIKDVATEVSNSNPRFDATRKIKMATKETHNEVVTGERVKHGSEDPPKALDVLGQVIRGKKGARRKKLYDEAIKNENPSILEGWWSRFKYASKTSEGGLGKKALATISKFYKNVFNPLFEAAHVGSLFYSGYDIAANVNFSQNIEEDKPLFHGMTLEGALLFVPGSNYLVGKMMGITTLGGGLAAQGFKTFTWGMLVGMNGSDPFTYFDNKPEDIVILHLEYFGVLMAQVGLFSGLHSKAGNPIYNYLTNIPVVRALPSMSRFYPLYTMRSTAFKPDFTGKGRLVSLAYVGPFHMGVAEITKSKGFLDAHEYLMWHRFIKVIHLGIWLKPLGAKLGQAGTLGQIVERGTGLIADWIDGLITPIKIGKPSYDKRLQDNVARPVADTDEVYLAAKQLEQIAEINHEIFSAATQSLDLIGLLGNWVAERNGVEYPGWQGKFHTGWRNEVQGITTYIEVLEKIVKENKTAALNDAMSMDYTLDALSEVGISIDNKSDGMALVLRSVLHKMWAERGKTDPNFKAYTEEVYNPGTPRKKAYWDALPTLESIKEINNFATKLHHDDIRYEKFMKHLRK